MHLVLQNQELLRIICLNATDHDLVALARVQKGIGNVALDVLWDDIELNALLHLFSPGVIDHSGEKAFIRSPPSTDWDSFDQYAARVRTLQRQIVHEIDFDNVLYFLKSRRRILPNLQHLIWPGAYAHEFLGLSTFFVPSLKTVDISGVFLPEDATHSTGLSCDQAVEVALLELADLGVSLRKLHMPIPHYTEDPLPTLYHPRWASLIRNGLVEVDIVPSHDTLNALSVVQTLEVLKLRFHPWISPIDPIDKTPGDFLALKKLFISTVTLLESTSLINVAGCVPSETIDIKCITTPSGYKFSTLVGAIVRSGRSRSLQSFSLAATGELDEDDDPLVDTIITVDHIRPLFPLNLTTFNLNIGYPLSMSNGHLEEITSAWPRLCKLCLPSNSNIPSVEPPESAISLGGLSHLASCRQLLHAALFLKIKQEDLRSLPKVVSVCPLSSLNVGYSKVEDGLTVPLTCFFIHLFPKIRYVVGFNPADTSSSSRWDDVCDGIKYVQAFKEQVRADS